MKSLMCATTALLVATVCQAEPASRAQVSWTTKGDPWVGQRAVLAVELYAPGYFDGAAVFDLPKIPETLVIPPEESPVLSSKEIDGVSYTVQRHELAVVAYRPGKAEIPPFKVRFAVKLHALDHDSVQQEVQTQAISFETKQPPGSKPGEFLITSADLKVTETWKPEPGKSAKTGDAFVRTFVWTASDVPGMAFPPFKADPIHGLGIYPAEPVVIDKSERGELHGERTDSVTYVCKTGGSVTIPALTLRWWDPKEEKMQQVSFPARIFDVTAPPPSPVPLSTRIERFLRQYDKLLVGGLVGLVSFGFLMRATWPWWKRFYGSLLPRRLAALNPSPETR